MFVSNIDQALQAVALQVEALKYCKSNVDAYFMSGAFYKKYSSSFTPLLEKEDGLWYYYTSVGNVSSKTLNNFTNGVIK